MAFYDEEDDEQPGGAEPGAALQNNSAVITPDGGAPVAGPKAAGAPDKPGNFVNLNRYLDANKVQAGKLGDQATGVINQSADVARQGVQALNDEAQQKIKPVAGLDDGMKSKIMGGAEQLSADERNQVKGLQKATYQGPQAAADLTSYQAASDASQKANQNISNAGTEQGRMSLIGQINAKPRTQGMNVFDNALLQAGGGREKLSQAQAANADVKGALGSAQEGIQGQIGRADDPSTPEDESAGAIGQTNKARDGAYKTVQEALSAWNQGFQPKIADAQKNLVDSQNKITQDISDNPLGLDAQTMEALGLSSDDRLYDLDLNSYLKPTSPSDITAANVASAEDYARYAALADLSGDQSGVLNQANIGQAGTAPKFRTDQAKLKNDMKAADEKFQNVYRTSKLTAADLPSTDRSGGALIYDVVGQSPEWLENVYIPALKRQEWNTDLYNPSAASAAAVTKELESSLANWKKNQYYDNVVNPMAANMPSTGTGEIDWSQIEAPTGGAGKYDDVIVEEDPLLRKKV